MSHCSIIKVLPGLSSVRLRRFTASAKTILPKIFTFVNTFFTFLFPQKLSCFYSIKHSVITTIQLSFFIASTRYILPRMANFVNTFFHFFHNMKMSSISAHEFYIFPKDYRNGEKGRPFPCRTHKNKTVQLDGFFSQIFSRVLLYKAPPDWLTPYHICRTLPAKHPPGILIHPSLHPLYVGCPYSIQIFALGKPPPYKPIAVLVRSSFTAAVCVTVIYLRSFFLVPAGAFQSFKI